MKKKITAYLMFALMLSIGLMTSCTKEGPAGPAGKDGTNGTNGTNGTDGTAGCIQCHTNSQIIEVKVAQWAASVHATGGLEVRNTSSCAVCHTSQGFLETVAATPAGGERPDVTTSGTINNPATQNCYTCHNIHSTYTAADWNNTTTSPVVLWDGGKTVDFGKGNLCANCHQARVPSPLPVVGGDSVTLRSPYWGVHHGPQASILSGTGGYEVHGSLPYSNSDHTTTVTDGCVTCHMATAVGTEAGGHNMGMTYTSHGHEYFNTAGCTECHADAGTATFTAKITATQTYIQSQLDALQALLVNRGVLTSSGRIVTGKKMSADEAGGILNLDMVEADHSLGVHNANYVRALLQNSIDALSK